MLEDAEHEENISKRPLILAFEKSCNIFTALFFPILEHYAWRDNLLWYLSNLFCYKKSLGWRLVSPKENSFEVTDFH